MRLAAVLVAAASLATCLPAASAQSLSFLSPGRQSSSQFLAEPAAQTGSCPVGMEVRKRGGMGQALAISPGSRLPTRGTQTLDLTIVNRTWSNIASMDAVVHTLTGKSRLTPVTSGDGGVESGEEDELVPMHLGEAIGTFKDVGISWSLENTNVIRYIEISRVTFSDGSIWSPAAGAHCRFRPDPIMLVAGR